MPTSLADQLWQDIGIPALQDAFGIPAVHANSDGDDVDVTIILRTESAAVGEFGERLEPQTILRIPTSYDAQVGDTFTVAGEVTDDDPYPDEVIWTAMQLISSDPLWIALAVRNDL